MHHGAVRLTGLGRPRGPDYVRPGVPIVPGDHGSPAPVSERRDGLANGPPGSAGVPQGPPPPQPGADDEPSALWRWLGVAATTVAVALLLLGGYRLWTSAGAPAVSPSAQATPLTGPSLRDVAALVVPSVVSVQVEGGEGPDGGGSGFVVDSDGHIVTNAHVVDGATGIRVAFSTGESTVAELVGVSEADDIAVLLAPLPSGVRPLGLGSSAEVRVGDAVLAIGSPLGLAGTVTAGIISAVDREVTLGTRRATALQTDASINPGNSGGPLVGADGRVVGVTTTIATLPNTGGGSIGIGFAIPVDRAAGVTRRLIEAAE